MTDKKWIPEVGVECEISAYENDFERCVPKYIGDTVAVVVHKGISGKVYEQHYLLANVRFRPLKSQAEMEDGRFALVEQF